MTVVEAARQLEISEQTNYRWRKEYGGLDSTQARKLKELEKENHKLKENERTQNTSIESTQKYPQWSMFF